MNSWTFFQWIFDNFDAQFLGAVQANANNLVQAVQAPLLVGITVWLAATASIELYGAGTDPVFMLVRKCVRAAIVLGLVGAAGYTAIFETFALTTLPNELTAAITGAQGDAGALTPAAFDRLLQGGWIAVVEITKNISVWEPKTAILAIFAILIYGVGALFIAIGFLVFIASHIMLGLAITVGPLFVAMLLWEKTVYLFSAWISTLLALIMTQVLVVALLALLLTTETNLIQQITALGGANGANANDIGGQVHFMIEACLLYFMIGYLAPKIEKLAEALARGAAPGIAGLSAMAHGALGRGASAAGSEAASGARAGAVGLARSGAAGMRSVTPASRAP
jgi:type IV secretion system protein VirB6